jgi:endonuclease/exonuclease/phosphatase family metal-dependent hydrolase
MLKIFGVLIGAVLIFAVALIGWLSVREFKPDEVVTLNRYRNLTENEHPSENIKIITFNMGYGNLNKDADSFLDGGTEVRSGDKKTVMQNFSGIKEKLMSEKADVYFVQEIDENSTRSFGINQRENLANSIKGDSAYAQNYLCDFVPFPLPPIGKVDSGVMTLTDFKMINAERIALPCPFSWPVSTANLKRCLLVSYHDIEGSSADLVLVNLHLEAYDNGEGKIAQTKMLWEILEREYAKGNYVIAGGDFNQMFPGTEEKYPIFTADLWKPGVLEESALPEGWQYVFDGSAPTCRLLNKPYDEETSQHYVIDGFIISPNVELVSAETLDCGFEFSDHNPVLMEIKLK